MHRIADPSPGAKLAGRWILGVVQIFVTIVLAWHGLRGYLDDRWILVQLGHYFAPWFFLGLIPALVVGILGRRKWLVSLTVVLLLLTGQHYWPLFSPQPRPVDPTCRTQSLRVMTFNMHYANQNASAITRLILSETPDLIAFQEFSPKMVVVLPPEITAEYPHRLYDFTWGKQLALLSRYPLTELPQQDPSLRAQHALLEIPTQAVALWNVHPYPAIFDNGQRQKRLLTMVAEDISSERRATIVLGDFNTTDQTNNYGLIANHLVDVHRAVGRGFGFTFPVADLPYTQPWNGRIVSVTQPLFRLDYIFVSHHFRPCEIELIRGDHNSDHYPVVATLGIPSEK